MSTNVSKQKRKELIDKIEAFYKYIASAKQDENTRSLLTWLSDIEKEINAKKFGLVFEEHREAIDEILETHTPVLTEKKKLFIDNGGQMNFLIEGDNLAALQLLLKTHKGKIDVIYIDPPYNTEKNDFMYDDKYIDENDGYRHSKWLSFMSKRLEIAKKLLAKDGVIFISIDDNELANLKILCDTILDANNFLSNFAIQVRYAEKSLNEEKPFKPLLEYLLIFAKNISLFEVNREKEEYTADKFIYEIIEIGKGKNVNQNGHSLTVFKKDDWKIIKHKTGHKKYLKETWVSGSIYTTMSYGKVFQNAIEPRIKKDGLGCLYKIHGRGDDGLGFRYYTGPKRANATRGKMYSGVPLTRVEEMQSEKGSYRYPSIPGFQDFSPDYGNIRHEGGIAFNGGKKPVKLLKQLINYHSGKNITVLDFFAGSGSTGHAVIAQNEDGGSRTFILVTNNQNNICSSITYPRLKNVIKEFNNKTSLKYYKIDYISISDKFYYEYADGLLEHIRELVELENGINFLSNDKIAIVLSEEELDDFVKNIKKHKNCRKLYRGHDVLVSSEQTQKLKTARIKVNVIPDYYYGEMEI
jgi:adenine-specific DNA-methyltransferase